MASKQRLTAADLSADGSCLALRLTGLGGVQALPSSFCSACLFDVLDCEFLFNVYLLIRANPSLAGHSLCCASVFNIKQGIIY